MAKLAFDVASLDTAKATDASAENDRPPVSAVQLLAERQLRVCESAQVSSSATGRETLRSSPRHVRIATDRFGVRQGFVPRSRDHLAKAQKQFSKFKNSLGFPLSNPNQGSNGTIADVSRIETEVDEPSAVSLQLLRSRHETSATAALLNRSASALGNDHHVTKLIRASTPGAGVRYR